jgi:hypothetical protein
MQHRLPILQPLTGEPGTNECEDAVEMIEKYPLINKHGGDNRAKSHLIKVPAYILASMSTSLHTVGSARSYEDTPHDSKWWVLNTIPILRRLNDVTLSRLRFRSTQEWHDLLSNESVEDFKRFLDFHTKNIGNGWEKTPRVCVSTLLPLQVDHNNTTDIGLQPRLTRPIV